MAWTAAGINHSQLTAYLPFDAAKRPVGDEWSDPSGPNVCGIADPASDTWDFWALIENGLLQENSQPAMNISYCLDDCGKTVYVHRNETDVMISYDSPERCAAKGQFIGGQGLKGFAIWETAEDSNNILLHSTRKTTGV